MNLIFFGHHDSEWNNALSDNLLPSLMPKICSIKNIYDINKLVYEDTIIIPIMESHMLQLYKHKVKWNNCIMPSIENIITFSYKNNFYIYMVNNNFEQYLPKTYTTISNIDKKCVVVKPFNLNAATGVYITQKKYITNKLFKDHIIQELIIGSEEFVSHIVSDQGKIIECMTYKYKFKSNVCIKRPRSKYELEKVTLNEETIDIFEKILTPCRYTGILNINFKYYCGKIKIFEVNPRLGGSLMLSENKFDLHQIINASILSHLYKKN